MIIENSSGDIKNYGEIKEYKISIDAKNLEFITTLLSSNLYSDPEGSFIREIVSNAWDSHVEANNTNTPIIIKGTKNSDGSIDVLIRDYGTGISPERYEEIYCNIGSSTKRDTNNYIGGFGLGRFSALAVSNSVYITSYYEGIRYNYVLVKSGNTIKSTLLDTQPTEDHNGVEVLVKNIPANRADNISKAISKVGFFPNVYYGGIYEHRNKSTITKLYNKFAVINDNLYDHRILIGNVLYAVNTNMLDLDNRQFNFRSSGIAVRFNIGELEVTPNRENIIYNKKSIDLINQRFREAIGEVRENIIKIIGANHTDIKEYCDLINTTIQVNLIDRTFKKEYNNSNGELELRYLYEDSVLSKRILYKGRSIDRENVYRLNSIFKSDIFGLKYFFNRGKFIKEIRGYYGRPTLIHKDTVILKKSDGKIILNEALKTYLLNNYSERTAFIGEINFDALELYIRKKQGLIPNDLLKEVCNYVKSWYTKLPIIDVDNDPNILKIKADIKANRKTNSFSGKKVILRYNGNAIEYSSIEAAIEGLRNFKDNGKILTLSYIDEYPILEFIRTYIKKNLVIIEARKDIVDYLKKQDFSFIVNPKYLISESNRDLCRYAIVINYLKEHKLPYDSDRYPKCFISSFIKDFVDPSVLYSEDINKILEILSIPSYIYYDYKFDYLNIDSEPYKDFINSFNVFIVYYNKIHTLLTELFSNLSRQVFSYTGDKVINAIITRIALKQKDTLRLKYSAYLMANSNKFIKSLI